MTMSSRGTFLWGAATSAHQVEGYCTNNNWYQFESAVNEKGIPRIAHGQSAGIACDHWCRFAEDIRLMKDLSLNAYRLSVEWSKIEPQEGVFDDSALEHYVQVVEALLANGITPMVTLHHFTDPIWFSEKGGFLREDAPAMFCRFVEKVVRRLGHVVGLWGTINEPLVYAVNGYVTGEFPPASSDPGKAIRVLGMMLRTHAEAYRLIKTIAPDAQVGLPVNLFVFDPPSPWNPVDIVVAHLLNANMNLSILHFLTSGSFTFHLPGVVKETFRGPDGEVFDFIGVNYYTRFRIRVRGLDHRKIKAVTRHLPGQTTDMGWEIYPHGLSRVLDMVASITSKPVYITENGIADDSDTKRAAFIAGHIQEMKTAIDRGIDVRGYFYWSLMDNFEWSHGFDKRFGLYHVDFATQKRTLRPGSEVFRTLIAGWNEHGH